MKAWIAKHTSLPSFAFTASKGSWYVIEARDETGRAWEAVAVRGTGSLQVLSDPLALPGVPTTYTVRGTSTSATLTRDGVEWWRGLVSRLNGRSIPGLAWNKNGDPRSWDSGVKRFTPGLARWPMDTQPMKGSGVFDLLEPAREGEVWRLLQRREPLLVFPGERTPGLPPRVVTVDSVASTRLTGDGMLTFSVDWVEVPLDSPMLRRPGGSAGVGTVTWGEWDAHDGAWRRRTYADLCRLIAGMP